MKKKSQRIFKKHINSAAWIEYVNKIIPFQDSIELARSSYREIYYDPYINLIGLA